MNWTLSYVRSSERDLSKLPAEIQPGIFQQLGNLSLGPHNVRSEKMKGRVNRYRIRVGSYRIVFAVDKKQKHIEVEFIGTRQEAERIYGGH
ncbi:MAG: type II toxin-antitoxin system RelE/ParE family toxin [Bryobacterales bacterium]|nr:type II toxin-antitoxin system RelE/ParE family toxin [Bryobacterales bacterium]